jgi:hypothetical protein
MQSVSTAGPRTSDRLGAGRPIWRRAVVVTVAVLSAVAVAAVAVQIFGSGGSSSYLLAPGPTQPPREFGGAALIGYVSPEELVRNTPLVFVGTVVGEGDPQLIGDPIADPLGQGPTVQPVHFAVEQTLRGEPAPTLDLLFPAFLGDTVDIFGTGDRLLVFARPVIFGHNRITGMTPSGYNQGVFRMESDEVARNEFTGVRMSIPGLAAALGRGEPSSRVAPG